MLEAVGTVLTSAVIAGFGLASGAFARQAQDGIDQPVIFCAEERMKLVASGKSSRAASRTARARRQSGHGPFDYKCRAYRVAPSSSAVKPMM